MSLHPKPQRLSLLLAEVNGTLVDDSKAFSDCATAVRALRRARASALPRPAAGRSRS